MLLDLLSLGLRCVRDTSQVDISTEEVSHDIEHLEEHLGRDRGLVRFTALQLDDFVENVTQEARQTKILLEVILHVEALLANENALDELVEVLILVTDERLDLIGLSVRDDLILHDLAVGRVREHDRQDGQRKDPRLLNEYLVRGVEADEERYEENLRVQIALAEFAQLALQVGLRLLEDAVDECFVDGDEGTFGQLRGLRRLDF